MNVKIEGDILKIRDGGNTIFSMTLRFVEKEKWEWIEDVIGRQLLHIKTRYIREGKQEALVPLRELLMSCDNLF